MRTINRILLPFLVAGTMGVSSCKDDLRAAVNDVREENKQQQEQLDSANAENAKLQAQIDALQQNDKKIEDNIKETFKRVFDKIDQNAAVSHQDLMTILSYIYDLQGRVSALQINDSCSTKNVASLWKVFQFLVERVDELEDKTYKLKVGEIKCDNKMSDYEAGLQALQEKIEKWTLNDEDLKDIDKKLWEMAKTIMTLTRYVTDLQEEHARFEDRVDNLEANQQKLQDLFNHLSTAIDQDNANEVAEYSKIITECFNDLTERVKKLEENLEYDDNCFDALWREVDDISERIENFKKRLSNQFNNYVELEDRVDKLENQVIEKTYDHQDVAVLKTQLEKTESKWKMIAKVLVEVAQEQEAHLNNLDSITTSQDKRISALENNAGSSDSSDAQESHESAYSQEIEEAYQWAREHELTSSYPIEKANVFDPMSRLSFFKSINMFAQEYQLNTVEFNGESQGNMDKLEWYVMLAKMLYGDLEIPEGDPGYKVYLDKLKADGIITITDPDQLTWSFIRGYLRILLKRIVEQKGLDTTYFYDHIINN